MMLFPVEFECLGLQTLGGHHMSSMEAFMSPQLLKLYLTATLFTPETPKVFCGLKHLTHLSTGIVMSR